MSGSRIDRHPSRIGAVALATAAALAGCAPGWHPNDRAVFACDQGQRVTVTFHRNTASLIAPDGGRMLLQRRGRGAFVFESATRSARLSGRNLTLTIGRMAPIRCRQTGKPAW
jgi:hypothetical protein